MTDEERALEWFRNRRTAVTMKGTREMYDIAIRVLQERVIGVVAGKDFESWKSAEARQPIHRHPEQELYGESDYHARNWQNAEVLHQGPPIPDPEKRKVGDGRDANVSIRADGLATMIQGVTCAHCACRDRCMEDPERGMVCRSFHADWDAIEADPSTRNQGRAERKRRLKAIRKEIEKLNESCKH